VKPGRIDRVLLSRSGLVPEGDHHRLDVNDGGAIDGLDGSRQARGSSQSLSQAIHKRFSSQSPPPERTRWPAPASSPGLRPRRPQMLFPPAVRGSLLRSAPGLRLLSAGASSPSSSSSITSSSDGPGVGWFHQSLCLEETDAYPRLGAGVRGHYYGYGKFDPRACLRRRWCAARRCGQRDPGPVHKFSGKQGDGARAESRDRRRPRAPCPAGLHWRP
jgi:hypothetical protein